MLSQLISVNLTNFIGIGTVGVFCNLYMKISMLMTYIAWESWVVFSANYWKLSLQYLLRQGSKTLKPSVSTRQSSWAINSHYKLIVWKHFHHHYTPIPFTPWFCRKHLLPTYRGFNFLALWLTASAFLTNHVRSTSSCSFHASLHTGRTAGLENLSSLFKNLKPSRSWRPYIISAGNA